MKSILTLAALVGLVACSTANAASLSVVASPDNTNNAIYLEGGAENGTFNTVIFKTVPNGSAQLLNPNSGLAAGVPRPAGAAFTYPNRLLNSDPLDFPGGQNWSLLGLTFNATELSYSGGPLGGNISTAAETGGRLFLGNALLGAGGQGTATVTLVNAQGAQVGPTLSTLIGIPEPASFGLAGLAALGFAALRRRS